MKKSSFSVKQLLALTVGVFETIETAKHFAACKFGYGFIARSTPTFKAPKTTAAEWAASFGTEMNVIKITKVTNARAYDYEENINKGLEKKGQEGSFKADAMSGYDWVVPNIIKRAQKDGSLQLCVSFKENDRTKFESFYIVGGDHFATADELAFIESHLYKAPNKSVKQSACGVADKDILMVRNYKFSNIIAVGKTPEVKEIWNKIG